MFQQLLHEDMFQLRLEAPNREALLAEMVALLPASLLTPVQKSEVLELLLQRERFGTTATGEGLAMPRCTLSGLTAPIACLGISRKGISYPSIDGEPVYLIFLTIFPEDPAYDSEKRSMMQAAETIFKDRFLKERLKISSTPEEACEIVLREANSFFHVMPAAGNQ